MSYGATAHSGNYTDAVSPRQSEIFARIENQTQECSVLMNLTTDLERRLSAVRRNIPPGVASSANQRPPAPAMSALSDRIVGNTATIQEVRERLGRILDDLEL